MSQEFEYQRQIMLDSLKEQEKDTSLYETVCRSLLSEKEFRRVRAEIICILCLFATIVSPLSSYVGSRVF
jgi:hypothetical protein